MAKIHQTFFQRLFGAIGSIFHNASQKLWNSLTQEEQNSIKDGSGIINVINSHLSDAPQIIVDELTAQFPYLPELETSLMSLCTLAGITPPIINLTEAVTALQSYLKAKEGTVWQWASSSLAQLLSVILAPQTTVFAKVSTLIEFAYTNFIKKK